MTTKFNGTPHSDTYTEKENYFPIVPKSPVYYSYISLLYHINATLLYHDREENTPTVSVNSNCKLVFPCSYQ